MKTVKLGEILESQNSARRPIKAMDREPGSTPYLGASGVVDYVEGFTHDGTFLCLSEDGENLRSRKAPVAWVQEGRFWANNHLHVFSGSSKDELKFVQYAIESQQLSSYITGSTQPKLTKANALSIEVPTLDFESRCTIGSLLSALDEKIAANEQVMSISKELSMSLADSATGRCALREVATIYKSPIGVAQMDGKTVTSYSLPAFDDGWAPRVDGGSVKSGKTLLKQPVVLVSKLNPRIPRIWGVDSLPKGDSVASTEFVALVPKSGIKVAHLWAAVSSPDFTKDMLHRVTGTTGSHQRITPQSMMEVEVNDPRELTDETKALLESLLRSVNLRAEENQRLARTRDELLPLLMDGRITVKDAERVVEEA